MGGDVTAVVVVPHPVSIPLLDSICCRDFLYTGLCIDITKIQRVEGSLQVPRSSGLFGLKSGICGYRNMYRNHQQKDQKDKRVGWSTRARVARATSKAAR